LRSGKRSLVAVFLIGFLLSFPMFLARPLVASSDPTADHRLGFWLQEGNVMSQYSAQTFFDTMFLTAPYPSSVEVMIFSIQQAESNGQPCSSASSYISGSENYWGTVAQMADSYPNIQLVYEIAFIPSSSTYGLSCFETFASYLAQYASVYGIGIEGEYTNSNNGLTQTMVNSAYSYVNGLGKQFVNYYLTDNGYAIPSGGSEIGQTNFPGGDSGGYDQVGSLSDYTSSYDIGLSSGYYANFQFPGTVTCPIGASAMTSSTAGWNQCVEQTEVSTALQQPSGTRAFVEFDVGFSTSYFTGVSGQSTEQVFDNPTLRNWIWTDPNYQPNFILSTSSPTTTTTSTSSTTSTTSTSTTSTSTKSTSTTATTSSSSSTGSYTLSTFVACPTGVSSCGTTSPSGSTDYAPGAQVTLTATPAPGYQFSSWTICTDACKPITGNPLSFAISTSGNATANFVSNTSTTTTTTTTTTTSNATSTTTSTSTTATTSTSTTTTNSTTTSSSSSSTTKTSTTSSETQVSTAPQSYPLSVAGGCPSNGAGLYPAGTTAIVTFQGVCERLGGTGTRVASWSLDGGSPVPVQTNDTETLTIVMNGPHALTFNTVEQYALTLDYGAQLSLLSVTQPSIPGDYYWYDSGAAVLYAGTVNLQNFTAVGYALDGGAIVPITNTSEFLATFLMTGTHTLHVLLGTSAKSCPPGGCPNSTTYAVTIQSNADQPSGAWVDGAYYPKPVTFAWEAGSVHNITAAEGVQQASMRTSFSHWSGLSDSQSRSIELTANESGRISADYSEQDLVRFAFTDASGGALIPDSVTLSGAAGNEQVASNMTAWVDQGVNYVVRTATWMGWNVITSNDSTFSVSYPSTLTFLTDVYPQTVKVTDAYGLPVQGAGVNVTALNGYSMSLVTDGQGTAVFRVPEGLFSATISYFGVDDQVVSSTEGSHDFSVSFMLSYPLIATIATVTGVVAFSLAYFWFRKKPATGIYMFSDS